jgi:hypothetical protein
MEATEAQAIEKTRDAHVAAVNMEFPRFAGQGWAFGF